MNQLAWLADDNLMDIFRFLHPIEWVLTLSRVSSLWRILCFELVQKEFDKIQTNNRSNPALRNFEQIFSTDKGQLFMLRSIKKSLYQCAGMIVEKHGSLMKAMNVNYSWLKMEMEILIKFKNRKFFKNLCKSGNVEHTKFLAMLENEKNEHPFKNLIKKPLFGSISIFGEKLELPSLSDQKLKSIYPWYHSEQFICDPQIMEDSSLLIPIIDTSNNQNIKFFGRLLNEIREAKGRNNVSDIGYWNMDACSNNSHYIYRPVILLGMNSKSGATSQQIQYETLNRMSFNLNGSLYVEMGTSLNESKIVDKVLLYGLLLLYLQKVYKIQFR